MIESNPKWGRTKPTTPRSWILKSRKQTADPLKGAPTHPVVKIYWPQQRTGSTNPLTV